jgi:serine/threonine-protein kinase
MASLSPRPSNRCGAAPALLITALAAGLFAAAPPARAAEADLRAQGYAVLQTYCLRCHGEEFSTPGLDMRLRDTMLTSDDPDKPAFLVPGRAKESRIYLHAAGLRQDKMPPEDEPQPTPAEIELLAKWIDAGAEFPDVSDRPPRAFVGERQLVEMLLADIQAQPEAQQPFLRYFTIGHLWNDPTTSDETLAVTRAAVSKLVNSLSNQKAIVPPVPVGPDGLVLRIDMRDYGWSDRTHWLPLLAEYPYGLRHSDALARRLYGVAGSDLPYIRGDWFCHHATRPALYHRLAMLPGVRNTDHVGLPDSQQRLEQLLGVDLAGNFQRDRVMRAGIAVGKSGVSDHNRIVERHDTAFGYYWISYDSAASDGRQNHTNFPLGPRFPGLPNVAAFDHDGGEIIFSLPNGLQAYLLTTAAGERLEKGPDEIVQDKARHSGSFVIVNAVSCMGCHKEGIITFTDTIRPAYENRAGDVAEKVRRIYPTADAMAGAVARDREDFLAAVRQAVDPFLRDADGNPLDPAGLPEPITDVSKRYDLNLSVADVARELGLPADRPAADKAGLPVAAAELPTAIRTSASLRRLELAPLAEGERIKRAQWERANQRVSRELGLGLPFQVQ